MGSSNILPGRCLSSSASGSVIKTPIGDLTVKGRFPNGASVSCIIRPELITITAAGRGRTDGTVSMREFLGATSELSVNCGQARLLITVPSGLEIPAEGSQVGIDFRAEDILAVEE
jgi:ABC-type Fe3+/spermidine/putrescine transport system ATPase subunit